MNTSKLKSFAPEVRRQLMEAVGRKLDYVLTADTADLRSLAPQVASLRRQAESRRPALVERVAYTWFNRLAALRFLDARNWHPFRARVLTPANPDETQPEILKLLRAGSLPEELRSHTDPGRLNDLLDGRLPTAIAGADPQGEVYRHLVLAACRFYHALMPFLFEELDDETELLLPDDLLTAASVAEGFRTEIDDDDCSEVEILGWLYQFYISEKKDAVMAQKKAVPSEDIPAVTQLFTPHWIVRYLVENSLGRLWLNSRPNSRLKEHMPYYVENPEGQAPADSLTVATPEEIRLLDPACGSGHMLTYAFDLLVKIYEDEGHAPGEIPERILTHNLFGLEICPRAAQLAQFALVCKAREQSRAAFRRPVQPQVMCLSDAVLTPDEVKSFTEATGVTINQDELAQIHQFREHTKTFGSLIQPVLDGEKLAALASRIGEQTPAGDLLVQNTHRMLRLVLNQAEMLSQRYQVVVANPPYMGNKKMCPILRAFIQDEYPQEKYDLFAAFISRSFDSVFDGGLCALVTMQSWMFTERYEPFRANLLKRRSICCMAHMGNMVMGIAFGTAATVFSSLHDPRSCGSFFYVTDSDISPETGMPTRRRRETTCSTAELEGIPGSPVVYWASGKVISLFSQFDSIGHEFETREGLATADNDSFIRQWHEIPARHIHFGCDSNEEAKSKGLRWFPYVKGGSFRKWWGNSELVVDWEDDGRRVRNNIDQDTGKVRSHNYNGDYAFRRGFTWSGLSSGGFSVRHVEPGSMFDAKGPMGFPSNALEVEHVEGFLNSSVTALLLEMLAPTMDFKLGHVLNLPLTKEPKLVASVVKKTRNAVDLARADWDNFETSWDFRDLPLLRPGDCEVEPGQAGGAWKGHTLAESWANYASYCAAAIRRMQELETENNRLWIDAYGLQDELAPDVPEDEITLARADARKDMAAFLSYAVGCMMGRYSLDRPGLILADAGDTVEDYLAKVGRPLDQLSFPPDEDAIIPVLDSEWFEDDIVARTREFLRVTFGEATLNENLRFIEDSLGKPLQKYFLSDFYKDHLQTYKKRPIYWLFQSPKKGFGALVYLHRYTRDTVNTLLNDYLRDYLKKVENRLTHLDHAQATADSPREKNAARKEAEKLRKTQKECEEWERDVLLPLAQQRIEIDLDDGVKANYPKFGKALAKVPGLS